MKKSLLFFLFFLLSQVVAAQSQTGGKGALGDSRTYKKVSGDTVRLRPSVAAKIEKEEKQKAKAEAKVAKSGAGAAKGKTNAAKSGNGASKNKAKNAKSGTAKSQTKSTKNAAKTAAKTTTKPATKAAAKPEVKAAEPTKEKAPRVEKTAIDSVQYEPPRYVLGDRVIMRGDSGHDVLSVAKILVKKLYLDEAAIVYTPDGGAVYEDAMVKAILLFQEFNDFYPDGIIGRELIKALRKRK